MRGSFSSSSTLFHRSRFLQCPPTPPSPFLLLVSFLRPSPRPAPCFPLLSFNLFICFRESASRRPRVVIAIRINDCRRLSPPFLRPSPSLAAVSLSIFRLAPGDGSAGSRDVQIVSGRKDSRLRMGALDQLYFPAARGAAIDCLPRFPSSRGVARFDRLARRRYASKLFHGLSRDSPFVYCARR